MNGTTIACTDTGPRDAANIVFGLSLLFGRWILDAQCQALCTDYRCNVSDSRGYGDGAAPRAGYDTDALTCYMVSLVQQLDVAPVNYVGLSVGGFVGQGLAARHGTLFRSLVLLNTSEKPETATNIVAFRRLGIMQRFLSARQLSRVLKPVMFGSTFLVSPVSAIIDHWISDLKTRNRQAIHRAILAVARRPAAEHELAEATAPTLVISSADDDCIPTDTAPHLCITTSTLMTIDDCGQMRCLEPSKQTSDTLQDFISAADTPYAIRHRRLKFYGTGDRGAEQTPTHRSPVLTSTASAAR